MRCLLACVLVIPILCGVARAEPEPAGAYVVLTGVDAQDPYHEAARLLAAHHGTQHILRFDPEKPDGTLEALRRIRPAHVAIVVRPEQIHVNSVRRILVMATKVDDDPFVDFAHGFVTGATPAEAAQFVRRIVEAAKTRQPLRVGSAAVWGGAGASKAFDDEQVVGPLRLPRRSLRFRAPEGKERDQAFLDKELASLQGCGAILMGGHGMPWEIGHGPRAEDIAKLELFPAVAFNYACHTGVTQHYPQREYRGKDVVERLLEVESKRSFALAVIRSGVTGYVAYVNPRPAGPELHTDFQRVLAGATLGESRRADYAKILLGYLGFGEKGIVPPAWEDGRKRLRSEVDAVRHMMLDGATGGILYGDPALRPYEVNPHALPVAQALSRDGDDILVALSVAGRVSGLWCADPFRRYPDGKVGMARKLYGRFALPADVPAIRTVRIETATQGGKPVPTLEPVWAVEHDRGTRYLHVKANFDYGGQGDVAVRMRASP